MRRRRGRRVFRMRRVSWPKRSMSLKYRCGAPRGRRRGPAPHGGAEAGGAAVRDGSQAEQSVRQELERFSKRSGSDEGKIAFESKARGAKRIVQTLVSTMKEHGFIGGNVAISHCDNLALAQTLKNSILDIWENTSIEILPTRGLCSYYAERGGLIVSY